MQINPMRLDGPWTKGYSLDKNILYSIYYGENEYGYPVYNSTRTKLGELIYQLKYQSNLDVLSDIIELISPFLDNFSSNNNVDVIIAAPPSNTSRSFQPVNALCQAIGEYINKPVINNFLSKSTNTQLKGLKIEEKQKAISGSIIRHKGFLIPVDVLVIDDLYQTGTTLREITHVLQTDSNIKNIYVLTMTKTRK